MKYDGIMKAVTNHDKAMLAKVSPTPSNACINHERVERKVTKIERTNLKESKVLQTPKQQIDWIQMRQTCVSFGRVEHVKPIMDGSLQVHSR